MFKATMIIMALVAVISVPMVAQSVNAATIPDAVAITINAWSNDQVTDDQLISALEQLLATDVLRLTNEVGIDELNFAFTPVKPGDPDNFRANAEQFEEFLEGQLGIEVDIQIPTSYESIIEGLRFGHIDAAIMDTGPGWLAHSKSGAEVIMAEVTNGRIYYQATAWVSVDNDDIDSIDDTLGKKVSFTSKTGSSGFVRPFGALTSQGYVTVEGDDVAALDAAISDAFESHSFPNSYGGAADLLARGLVDVAFGNDRLPTYLPEDQQNLIKPAFVIGPVPSHVLVVSPDMSENTKKALLDAMLMLNTEQYSDILFALYKAEAMLPTTTMQHMGDFGKSIDSLPGFESRLLDKYNQAK